MNLAAPFEHAPVLAIGVSGGADSMALCLLAARWAEMRHGHVVALIVDHGLRRESVIEAHKVAEWLGAYGISHRILPWHHQCTPHSGIQHKARNARRALMTSWCEINGVVHLLLGHHGQDQAETVLMRQRRSSEGDGLAGMALITETSQVRVLRPLLHLSPALIRDSLRRAGVPWIEDPSNEDTRYERVRTRRDLPVDLEPVLEFGRSAARARAERDDLTARLIAGNFTYWPGGHVWGNLSALGEYPRELVARAVARIIRTLTGRVYLVRNSQLRTLLAGMLDAETFSGATLGGCRFLGWRGRLLVCREAESMAPPLAIEPGGTVHWDRRFRCRLATNVPAGAYSVGALGSAGWAQIRHRIDPGHLAEWPSPARNVLPALHRSGRVVSVPHLSYAMVDRNSDSRELLGVTPMVPEPFQDARFFIASVLD